MADVSTTETGVMVAGPVAEVVVSEETERAVKEIRRSLGKMYQLSWGEYSVDHAGSPHEQNTTRYTFDKVFPEVLDIMAQPDRNWALIKGAGNTSAVSETVQLPDGKFRQGKVNSLSRSLEVFTGSSRNALKEEYAVTLNRDVSGKEKLVITVPPVKEENGDFKAAGYALVYPHI